MKLLILGATGLIGSAVANAALAAGHHVTGLARSPETANILRTRGVTPLRGDLRNPLQWLGILQTCDAIIQCATTWDDDMGAVDLNLTHLLIQTTKSRATPLRVIYTGGCWLYGETGDIIAADTSDRPGFAPFDWMLTSADLLLAVPHLNTTILHPAMVYDDMRGALERYHSAAVASQPIAIWGDANTRWPLIHAQDLARAYTTLLSRPDALGHLNASTETGVPAHKIADKVAATAGSTKPHVILPPQTVRQRFSATATGAMLDQQMASPRLRSLGWRPLHAFT